MVAAAGEPGSAVTVAGARHLLVEGVVQGVGFRPFVHALATRRRLAGWVRNTAGGVEIEVEGEMDDLDGFVDELILRPPPLACIDRIRAEERTPFGHRGFVIQDSRDGDGFQPVPPDVATCPACLAEVRDPGDRRFGYPFTNCTHCGPRFTIIRALPYDRPSTTMAGFTMCGPCRREYQDPGDRRFHAEPNACPTCGPHLALLDAQGAPLGGDPLTGARRRLRAGAIVAIRGIGGFHLACDATSEPAVRRLRERKGRQTKPLAVMVPDLAAAERLCRLGDGDRRLLLSPARPIVLLPARPAAPIAPSVAPGLGQLGVMLPYSPLHHLLFAGAGSPPVLVLTSGNRSEEPIAIEVTDALVRLRGIADAFLVHDRPIEARCDDSVVRAVDGEELPIRRSRGLAPVPLRLPFEVRPLLACGAELKNTVCVARGVHAFLSPHVGDLENYETYVALRGMVARLTALFRVRPEAIVHDLHPGYLSTRFAREQDPRLPRVAVQHHHAHVAACMAEHGLGGRLIGVAFDGAGHGSDGAVWGGEFLVADYAGFRRAAHLAYVPLAGGDLAARQPFRMALAHLRHAGLPWDPALPAVAAASERERAVVARQLEGGLNAPPTSSVGRLFDAVASLVGLRHRAAYEAQAAMELEGAATVEPDMTYPFALGDGVPAVLDPAPIVRAIVGDAAAGVPVELVAARFHATLARAVAETCGAIRAATGLGRVVLTGGVFQNVTLLRATRRAVEAAGFEVFRHRLVPPNDGGLALGQIAVAHAQLAPGG